MDAARSILVGSGTATPQKATEGASPASQAVMASMVGKFQASVAESGRPT